MVVGLRQMSQHHRVAGFPKIPGQEAPHVAVREVALPAQDPLLERPRVGAVAQQAGVVVRLDEDGVARPEGLHQVSAHVAQVGGVAESVALGGDHEGVRRRRVVGDGHARDPDRPEGARLPRLEHVVARDLDRPEAGRRVGPAGAAEPDPPFRGEGGGAAGMVAVLVGDEHGREGRGIDPRGQEALRQRARAQAGIDQDGGPVAFHEGGVAGATGPQHAEAKAHEP